MGVCQQRRAFAVPFKPLSLLNPLTSAPNRLGLKLAATLPSTPPIQWHLPKLIGSNLFNSLQRTMATFPSKILKKGQVTVLFFEKSLNRTMKRLNKYAKKRMKNTRTMPFFVSLIMTPHGNVFLKLFRMPLL